MIPEVTMSQVGDLPWIKRIDLLRYWIIGIGLTMTVILSAE